MTRLEILLQYLTDEPHEPFNRYALAMEYLAQQPHEARKHLEMLHAQHPDYLPLYYPLAQLYADLGEIEAAKHTYTQGIALAQAQQEAKTQAELQRAYHNLLMETED